MTIALYLLTLFGLAVYSYSQIDLNLTLFRAPWFLAFQNAMIQLGYYYRPLSAAIFTVLLILSFVCYFLLIKQKFSTKNFIVFIAFIALLSLISYPFLSHDIFNYLFDARIITTYGQNPYFLKALDFPADPWIRFMNWTHRTYPYGPIWLLISLIPSFLGFGKFILTLLNFKLLFLGSYLVCCYFINKINPKNLALFALNPLVIVEGLFSPHLDLVMLAFALSALLKFRWLNLLFSVGVKFSTLTLAPVFLFAKKKWFFDVLIFASYLGVAIQILSREVLPHYFLIPIGFTALSHNKKWHYLAIILSAILLFSRYLPFLYTGSWFTYKLWPL